VIISERCGCTEDLVATNRNGYHFDPLDSKTAARILTKVAASDPSELSRMGRESRRIIAHWGPERFASGLHEAAFLALRRPVRLPVLDRYLVRLLIERREESEAAA
jgi:hypothetical protein